MSPGEVFCKELLEAMPTPHARMLLAAQLARYAGQTLYLPQQSKGDRRAQAARQMLNNGMSPADIAAILSQRFNICRRTAARDVSAARKMST